MAELVGAFAASHGPLIVRDWAAVSSEHKARLTGAFEELGRRMQSARPDTIIVVAPDHWVNFFLDNMPSVCLGVGETHEGPPEPFLRDFPHKTLAGDPALAMHIANTAAANDFEPSLSHHLVLDHGSCIPLWRMNLPEMPRIVPLIVNAIEPPFPSVHRCIAWGKLIAEAVGRFPGDRRVAVLATGGLSHSIGEPTMGDIDEAFDETCIRMFRQGGEAELSSVIEDALTRTGNGGQEVRSWAVAHGAAGARGFDLIDYLPVPEVYVGCGFAHWAS